MQHFDFESTINELHHEWSQLYFRQIPATKDGEFPPDDFRQAVKRILDESALTKAWSHEELVAAFQSPNAFLEQRTKVGPVEFIQPWRDAFWRYEMSCILLTWNDQGIAPPNQLFCLEFLAEELEGSHLLATPPISPSFSKPDRADLPAYGLQDSYVTFANTNIKQYLAEQAKTESVVSSFWQRASSLFNQCPYDPHRIESIAVLSRILSAISVLRTSAKLGLLESSSSTQHEALLAYLAGGGELNFRFRNDPLWPKEKRPRIYVDLQIHDVLAQVLEYRRFDWNRGITLRSLPLKDGNSGTEDGNLLTTKLRRIDIEMAVWCEFMLRILRLRNSSPPTKMKNTEDTQTGGDALNHLLPHQRSWARNVVEAISRLPQHADRSMQRFVAPELSAPHLRQDEQVTLLPPASSRPTLDGNRFQCLLDWNLISPLGDWMDIRLLFVNEQGEISNIEYNDCTSDGSSNDLLEIDLTGHVWQQLNQLYSPFQLRCLFERIWFGYRADSSRTGATVIGVIDARRPIS